MTSWWRHRVQISVEIHLNEQAQERFHLDRKVRRYFNWVNVRWVNKAIKTAMWFHSTWMRCVLKRNRSWGFNASNTVFAMKTKKDSTRKRNFVCICVTDFFFCLRAGRGQCPSHWFPLDPRTACRDFPIRAGCPVLDTVLLLFIKHTNIWFSYKVPFKILSLAWLVAPNDYPAT